MNHVSLIGRLARNIEVKNTQSGSQVARFSLAVRREYKNKATGEYETDFINCTAWGRNAEFLQKYTAKGKQVGIEGSLQVSSYEKDGQKVYSTDVVVSKVTLIEKVERDNYTGTAQNQEQHIEHNNEYDQYNDYETYPDDPGYDVGF